MGMGMGMMGWRVKGWKRRKIWTGRTWLTGRRRGQ
jgi:hypothetical protein